MVIAFIKFTKPQHTLLNIRYQKAFVESLKEVRERMNLDRRDFELHKLYKHLYM